MGMYAEFHPNRTELWAVGGVPQRVEDLPDDRWRDGCPWSERAALCRRLPTPQCLERLAACLSPASPIDRLEAWRPVFAPRTRTWSRRLVAVHGADAR
jgi:hypothetical protein